MRNHRSDVYSVRKKNSTWSQHVSNKTWRKRWQNIWKDCRHCLRRTLRWIISGKGAFEIWHSFLYLFSLVPNFCTQTFSPTWVPCTHLLRVSATAAKVKMAANLETKFTNTNPVLQVTVQRKSVYFQTQIPHCFRTEREGGGGGGVDFHTPLSRLFSLLEEQKNGYCTCSCQKGRLAKFQWILEILSKFVFNNHSNSFTRCSLLMWCDYAVQGLGKIFSSTYHREVMFE